MAAKTPAEAVNNFIDPLQRAASCITHAVLNVEGGYFVRAVSFVLTLADGLPVPLKVGAGTPNLSLSINLWYRVKPALGERRLWNVQVTGYEYGLDDEAKREILSYHWHPNSRSWAEFPHVHIGAGADLGFRPLLHAHLRGERASLEDFLWVLIREIGVVPLRGDWESVLESSRADFQNHRTWSVSSQIGE